MTIAGSTGSSSRASSLSWYALGRFGILSIGELDKPLFCRFLKIGFDNNSQAKLDRSGFLIGWDICNGGETWQATPPSGMVLSFDGGKMLEREEAMEGVELFDLDNWYWCLLSTAVAASFRAAMLSTDGRLAKLVFGGMAPLWGGGKLGRLNLDSAELGSNIGIPGLLSEISAGSVYISTWLGGLSGFIQFLDPPRFVRVCVHGGINPSWKHERFHWSPV